MTAANWNYSLYMYKIYIVLYICIYLRAHFLLMEAGGFFFFFLYVHFPFYMRVNTLKLLNNRISVHIYNILRLPTLADNRCINNMCYISAENYPTFNKFINRLMINSFIFFKFFLVQIFISRTFLYCFQIFNYYSFLRRLVVGITHCYYFSILRIIVQLCKENC